MSASAGLRMQRAVFSAAVTGVGTLLVWRDRLLRRIPRGLGTARVERVAILSGNNRLDAVLVEPAQPFQPIPTAAGPRAVVLICHGIGETVGHWIRAQEVLAKSGVASLVFNYSGCGRSSGWISADQAERDALAAASWLHRRIPGGKLTLLGFSLGTGVAVAVAGRIAAQGVAVERLVLCSGYPAFREAARCFGMPLPMLVHDVWRTEETLRTCPVPVLVVHGGRDRLFPVAMAERLADASGGELLLRPQMGHADLHARARVQDWRAILERL